MKMEFNKNLVKVRELSGISKEQMAKRLGIEEFLYEDFESGKKQPDFEMLVRISDTLNCSLDRLFGRDQREYGNLIREEGSYGEATGKGLCLGVQDFRKLREQGGHYVDKTMLVKDFLDSFTEVSLITRPRRFGKTLNMSMLAEFLDCTKQSEDIFQETDVIRTTKVREMNQHPVIFLSFLNVKGCKAKEMLRWLYNTLASEYERYSFVIKSERLSEEQRYKLEEIYTCLWQGRVEEAGEKLRQLFYSFPWL